MKKLSLLALFVAVTVAFSACKKDDDKEPTGGGSGSSPVSVDQKQRSMFIDFTATWCGPCGKWGIPTFKQALSANGDDVVGFAVHATPNQTSDLVAYYVRPNNDTLFVSPLLGDILGGLNGLQLTGWPTLWLNDAKMSSSASAINSKITAKAAESPVAGVGVEVTPTANGFTARVGAKFFQATSGEYYTSVLITEDNITNRQNHSDPGQPAQYQVQTHDHITRGTAINSKEDRPNTFGDAAIASGSIESGKYVENSYTFTFPNFDFSSLPANTTLNKWTWKPENTNVVVILWKKNGTKYDFVNAVHASVK